MSTTKTALRYWSGHAPLQCDVCNGPISGEFIDGKTMMGPWAFMCCACHARKGMGLGTGKGQRYSLQGDGRWLATTPRPTEAATGL